MKYIDGEANKERENRREERVRGVSWQLLHITAQVQRADSGARYRRNDVSITQQMYVPISVWPLTLPLYVYIYTLSPSRSFSTFISFIGLNMRFPSHLTYFYRSQTQAFLARSSAYNDLKIRQVVIQCDLILPFQIRATKNIFKFLTLFIYYYNHLFHLSLYISYAVRLDK